MLKLQKGLLFVGAMLIAIPAQAENLIVKQAKETGMKQCLPAVEKISKFLVGDGKGIGINSTWNPTHPDKQAFSTIIEKNYSDGPVLISLTVTPVPSGQCYVEYEKVMQFNKSCVASSQIFKKAKYKGELNTDIGVLDNNGVKVFLIPSGSNCLVVVKESIMNGLEL